MFISSATSSFRAGRFFAALHYGMRHSFPITILALTLEEIVCLLEKGRYIIVTVQIFLNEVLSAKEEFEVVHHSGWVAELGENEEVTLDEKTEQDKLYCGRQSSR